ncbi:hypothetical protein Dimus_024522 [Dionaea muscipula]
MTPLRIPSPASDSPDYSIRGSEEASSFGDESCPPCELGKGNILHVSDGGIAPYDPESRHEILDPCTIDGAVVPETLSRGEDVTPLALSSDESPVRSSMHPAGCQALLRARQNKKLIEIATSKVHEWKDRWCWAYGPAFPYQNTPWRTSLPKLPPKKVLKKALSEAENFLVQVFDQRLKEGRLWDVNMKPSLSSLQWVGIISGSPDLIFPELKPLSSSFLSVEGGGSIRSHGPGDDDVGSFVGSKEAELQTPPLQDLTGIQSLDEMECILSRNKGSYGRLDGSRPQLEPGAESQHYRQLINVSQEAIVDQDAAWKKVKNLEEEIAGLHELHKELSDKYDASQDSVRHLEGSLKKAENQSTSRLTALEKAQSRLEKRITELEQQRPSSMDEMVDLWQASEEGKATIVELSCPSTKAGYNLAYQHFAFYLSEVHADKN